MLYIPASYELLRLSTLLQRPFQYPGILPFLWAVPDELSKEHVMHGFPSPKLLAEVVNDDVMFGKYKIMMNFCALTIALYICHWL